jgi:hypothetical protein
MQRLRRFLGRRDRRLVLVTATAVLLGAVAVALIVGLESPGTPAIPHSKQVYRPPGTNTSISRLSSNGARVAAIVQTVENYVEKNFVVLWRPGEAPRSTPVTPDYDDRWSPEKLHFEGADVVWAVVECGNNECYEEDAVWGGGKVEWRGWDGPVNGLLPEGPESASVAPWWNTKPSA